MRISQFVQCTFLELFKLDFMLLPDEATFLELLLKFREVIASAVYSLLGRLDTGLEFSSLLLEFLSVMTCAFDTCINTINSRLNPCNKTGQPFNGTALPHQGALIFLLGNFRCR